MRLAFAVAVLTVFGACFIAPGDIPLGTFDAGSFAGGTTGTAGGTAGTGGGSAGTGGGMQSGVYPCGECRTGSCVVLATRRSQPHALARDATKLYWLEADGGVESLVSMPIEGGPITALATGISNTWEISVDSTGVYGTDFFSRCVWKVPTAGGPRTQFVCTSGSPSNVSAVDPWVYVSTDNQLMRIKNDGSESSTIGNAMPYGPVLQDSPNSAYVTSRSSINAGQIYQLNGSGPLTPLASTEAVGHMAANANEIFWTGAFVSSSVWRMAKAGGSPQVLVQSVPNQPNGLAVDSTHAYVVVGQNITRANLSNGALSSFVDGGGEDGIVSMATDDDSVYWTSYGCGIIAKKLKQ